MLTRFVNSENVIVPNTENCYIVNTLGQVTDVGAGKIIEPGESGKLTLLVGGLVINLKPSVVVALAYKNANYPVQIWEQLDTLYFDESEENIHPSNLVWKFPAGGIDRGDGYFYIPMFSNYLINKRGEVFSRHVDRLISPYVDFYGYPAYGVNPDVGNRTIQGMHRLLGLAFLPYPVNADELDVNHIDGVKSNHSIGNLEWSTRQWNCIHAYSTGLRTDNRSVDVMDSFTHKVTSYYSLSQAAKELGVTQATVANRMVTVGKVVFPPGLQFRASEITAPWFKFEDPLAMLKRSGVPRVINVHFKRTGETVEYPSMGKAAAGINVLPGTLSWRLADNGRYEDNEFIVSKS